MVFYLPETAENAAALDEMTPRQIVAELEGTDKNGFVVFICSHTNSVYGENLCEQWPLFRRE